MLNRAMSWTHATFAISTGDGQKTTVSGLTSSKGLGLHQLSDEADGLGRYRWSVTHLMTGMGFLTVNARDERSAIMIANLVVDLVYWNDYATSEDLLRNNPDWIPRLIGIKHKVGGDWMELPNPAMNDPSRIVWKSK
jgi:hypothetical protein